MERRLARDVQALYMGGLVAMGAFHVACCVIAPHAQHYIQTVSTSENDSPVTPGEWGIISNSMVLILPLWLAPGGMGRRTTQPWVSLG